MSEEVKSNEFTFENPEYRQTYWHTCSHVMAQAVKRLWPEVKLAIGKAGRKRHMGIRPTVRGSVMNPCDHPHGGGEGRAPVGHSSPRTPWGKPALGLKTRKHHARSDKFIVKRANG